MGVLHDHALHDLEAALHAGGVDRLLLLDLNDLGWLFVLGFALGGFLGLSPPLVLILLHEGVKDHPLGSLLGEDRRLGWISLDATLTIDHKRGLGRPLLIIEHVSQRFLLLVNTVVYCIKINKLVKKL